jgi:serine/threonine-protein kinase
VDIYALGCVAYWLVTGQLVFDGPGAIKVMSDHIHTAPPPPSTRCPTPLPGELDQLILDCLAKEPAQRPASARELQVRLQAIPLDRPWTPERAEHWWSLISRASTVSDRSRTWSSRRRRARCAR